MKKAVSLILALTLALALALPTMATTGYMATTFFLDDGDSQSTSETIKLYEYDDNYGGQLTELERKVVYLKEGATIRVVNDNPDYQMQILLAEYKKYPSLDNVTITTYSEGGMDVSTEQVDLSDRYVHSVCSATPMSDYYSYLRSDGTWSIAGEQSHLLIEAAPFGYSGELPEETKAVFLPSEISFTLPANASEDAYYVLTARAGSSDFDLYDHWLTIRVVKDVAAGASVAYQRSQTVELDGKSITLPSYALKENGGETNYVKLRDLASLLSGTAAQFNVGWDGAVNIEAKAAYVPNGSEMTTPFSGDRAYQINTAPVRINGAAADLRGIVLTDDAGGGYTYFKLRDVGAALGFNVGWSAERGIYIESAKPYVG